MSNQVIPQELSDLLSSTALAHMATIGPNGEPQSSPVWFGWDGQYLRVSQTKARQKYRNLKKNPKIALSIVDPANPYRYIEVRGTVVDFEEDPDKAFIDEMAKTAGKDPYQIRRDMLAKQPRHRAVLDLVAEKYGWNKPPAAGRGRGIAMMEAFGSILAQVAEVSVTNGAVKVHKVWCAVDCGWVINPDTVKAQMEGGTIYGLTAALKGEITIQNGRVMQHHFNDYEMIRQNEAPEVEVHIVPSAEAPGGIGEPSTAIAAGALVNAIAAATGKRLYKLPIRTLAKA